MNEPLSIQGVGPNEDLREGLNSSQRSSVDEVSNLISQLVKAESLTWEECDFGLEKLHISSAFPTIGRFFIKYGCCKADEREEALWEFKK